MQGLVVKGFKRVNESVSPELLQPEELAVLSNMVLDAEAGHPKKRNGWTRFNTNQVDTTGNAISLHDVVDEAGSNYLLGTITTKLRKSSSGTGSWSDVKTGLTTGLKTRIASVGHGRFVLVNGTDTPLMIGGTAFASNWNLGITRPDTSNVTTVGKNAGSLTQNAEYKWLMVYYTEYGEISTPSRPFTHYVAATSNESTLAGENPIDMIRFQNLPVSTDSRVKGRMIFRTEADSEVYYLLGIIDNTITTYDDDTADSDLDTGTFIIYNYPPTKANYICYHRERLFLGNVTIDTRNWITPAYSNVGSSSGWTAGVEITATPTTGGSMTSNAVYGYRFVFLDINGNESDYIEISASLGASDTAVGFTNLPSYQYNQSGINTLRVYRTAADAGTFYFLADYKINIINFTDTASDGSLLGEYVALGTEAYRSAVVFSDIAKPIVFPLENINQVFPDDGDEITGIFDDADGVLVFKKKTICKIFTLGDPSNWQTIKISDNVGCTDADSLCKNENEYFFISNKKAFIYKGGQVVNIGEIYKDTLDTITAYYGTAFSTSNGWYVISCAASSTYYIIIYDAKLGCWYKFNITDARCVTMKNYGSNIGTILVGDGTRVIKYDTSVFDDNEVGSGITSYSATLRTKTFIFPDGITLYRIRKIFLNIKGYLSANQDETITITIVNPDSAAQVTTSVNGTSSTWTTIEKITDVMTGALKTGAKVYLEISGAGILEFGSARLDYRLIRRGKVA